MDNRHNLSDESAPWGNNVTRRTDSAVKSIDRLEQDFQQLSKQGSSALSRVTTGSGSISQVVTFDLREQEFLVPPYAYRIPLSSPASATSLTVRFTNLTYLGGDLDGGGEISTGLGGDRLGDFGPTWTLAPGGEPVGVVVYYAAFTEVGSAPLDLWVRYRPLSGSTFTPPDYMYTAHLMWGF